MGKVPVTIEQDSARGRSDNGNETTAGWKAGVNTDYSQNVNENFRHRLLIQATTAAAKNNFKEEWQYYHVEGTATWTDVAASGTAVIWSTSAFYSNGTDTTQQIGSGTYISANSALIEGTNLGATTEPDFSGNDEFECEACFQINSAIVSDGDIIRLRITSAGAGLDNYVAASLVDITAVVPSVARRLFMID